MPAGGERRARQHRAGRDAAVKTLAAALLFAISGACLAEGPGTQIRAGPPVLQRPAPPPAERDLERCQKLSGEEKDRCLKNLRAAAAADERSRGSGAIGSSTGGSSGAAGGASGPAAPGGATSR